MSIRKYYIYSTILGGLGVIFSGYLSATKFFSSTCAFNEPCPYFLGFPACYFGLGLFIIIFISSLVGMLKGNSPLTLKIITYTSGAGIVFAGTFVYGEIERWLSGIKSNFTLGLPTCVYGQVFFIIIFVMSVIAKKYSGNPANNKEKLS